MFSVGRKAGYLGCVFVYMLSACADDGTKIDANNSTSAPPTTHETAAHGETPHWTYAEAEEWGELSEEFATCESGTHQSPIDLAGEEPADLPNATIKYTPASGTVVNNGHTIQVDVSGAGGIVLDGTSYELVQYHFHGPSEHTVDGKVFPLEGHLVHKTSDGNLAVIGFLVDEGAQDNPAFDSLIAGLPASSEPTSLESNVDPNAMLPGAHSAFRYDGSLTTPPCSEGVEWTVLATPITMSAAQIAAITDGLAEPNNRPVQSLNDRELALDITD